MRMQGIGKKGECDHTLYKRGYHSEPLLEVFTYDSDDASESIRSPLNTLITYPGDIDSFYASDWKDSNEELSSQEDSVQQCRMLNKPRESCGMEEDSSHKTKWELMTEEVLPAKNLLVDTRSQKFPIPEVPQAIMGKSLLDYTVMDPPIEVQFFLTQPTSSLQKNNACFTGEEFLIVSDISDQNGNMTDTEQPTKSADMGLTISPDTLDENLDYICTLMQSNRHLKKCLKKNLAYCINQEEVVSSPFLPEIVETVSKGKHKTEDTLVSLKAEMAKDCKQRDMGDKGNSPFHIKRTCCLNHSEASLKFCERNALEFSLKQLLLQEGDMDFYRVINGLGEEQQKQLTHIFNFQHCSVNLEKKNKEMENLLLQEGDMNCNRDMQELEYNQKKQQTQIMDLYYDVISLGTKIKELEVDIPHQRNFRDTITTLKKSVADLTEAKNKATEEKDKAESCLKSTEEALASTKSHLKDCEAERSALMLQLKKFKADVGTLQEKLQEEVEQKNKYMSHCVELNSILHRKEQEIQELSSLKYKLEQKVSGIESALQKIKEKRDSLEKCVAFLQTAQQRQKNEGQEEKEKLLCKYNKLVVQIKILQVQSENEQAEMEKMQQQIHTFRMENGELQQQVTKDKNENCFLQVESARWKEQYDQIKESQALMEKMQYQIIKVLRYKFRLQQEELRKKEEIIAWKTHILGRLHLDMKSVHFDLSTRRLYTEENHSNSPYVQKASKLLSKLHSLLALTEGLITCQDSKTVSESSKESETGIKQKDKTKSHSIKKKTVEEKHEERTAAIHKLIIKERPSEGLQTVEAVTVQEESPHSSDLQPDLPRTKLEEYHSRTNNWNVFKDLESNLAYNEEECQTVTGEDETLQDDFVSLACKASDLQHDPVESQSI